MAKKKFSVEWSGKITRDIGWDQIEAETLAAAQKKWNNAHGGIRRMLSISEIER